MTQIQIDVVEINAQTNERIERSYTSEELAQIALNQAAQAELNLLETAKTAAKQAVLDKLGLTADEAALLLS
jgi:hypothetical protein